MNDLISRQAAIDAICKACSISDDYVECVERRPGSTFCDEIVALRKVPSAQPEADEWCADCKEYDHDKHCCPRWNRVIRTALEEAQPERKSGKWIDDGWHGDWAWETDGHGNCWHLYRCSLCNTKVKARSNFCPNCGAKMEE